MTDYIQGEDERYVDGPHYNGYDLQKFLFERGNRVLRLLAAVLRDADLDPAVEARAALIANEARQCLIDAAFISGVEEDCGGLVVHSDQQVSPDDWRLYSDGRPVASILDVGDVLRTLVDHPDPFRWSTEGFRGSTTDFMPLEPELNFEEWRDAALGRGLSDGSDE